jgi:hypothetical protein
MEINSIKGEMIEQLISVQNKVVNIEGQLIIAENNVNELKGQLQVGKLDTMRLLAAIETISQITRQEEK